MILISGDIKPSFSVASMVETKIMRQKAIITKSRDNILMEVNNMSVIDYMRSIGLASSGRIEGLNTIPFTIDFNDGGKPVVRAIFSMTPEGYAVCGGSMPINTTLGIGSIDHDDVISTTKESMKKLSLETKNNGLFIFSCVSRNMALGFDISAEMNTVQNIIGDKAPYFMSYSGGEICPIYTGAGKLINRFHNDTIITCLF
jgi:hypothetical protein